MAFAEQQLHSYISRHQQEVFALVVYLVGGDQDAAYDICSDSFASALTAWTAQETDGAFRIRLAGIAVDKSRSSKAVPSFDALNSLDITGQERSLFRIVMEALQNLDFEAKALVLLRDQLNFSHKEIAAIMPIAESGVKLKTEAARNALRGEIEKILSRS